MLFQMCTITNRLNTLFVLWFYLQRENRNEEEESERERKKNFERKNANRKFYPLFVPK